MLHGVYFDRSTALREFYPTWYSLATQGIPIIPAFDPLCVEAESVINIFMTEEYSSPAPYTVSMPCWPFNIVSPGIGGVAKCIPDCANSSLQVPDKLWVAIVNPWVNYLSHSPPQQIATVACVVNHELFHLLGLNHPFTANAATGTGFANNCADAPPHPQAQTTTQPYFYPYCGHLAPNEPLCDNTSKVSNNVMDYDDIKIALSPCQLGVAQGNLTSCLSRYIYQCTTCLPTDAWFTLNLERYRGLSGLWLEGRAAFNHDWYTLEIDDVTVQGIRNPGPLGPHYQVTKNRQLYREYLDGQYSFQGGHSYRITLTTHKNDNCTSVATYSQYYNKPRTPVDGPPQDSLVPVSTPTSTSRHD